MTESTMTLEQVRDDMLRFRTYEKSDDIRRTLAGWINAIDAHLTRTPAQVTDEDFDAAWMTFRQCEETMGSRKALRKAFDALSARLAQPVVAKVPEELPRNGVTVREHEYNAGWNDCREVMLSHMNESQPHPQAAQSCTTCEPAGVFDTDGNGPYDCYACGKKAKAAQGGEAVDVDDLAEYVMKQLTGFGRKLDERMPEDLRMIFGSMKPLYTHPDERAAVPEGWVPVPCEPTPEMCAASEGRWTPETIWKSMLSAAPTLAGKEGV